MLIFLSVSQGARNIRPYFWDEIEQLLGPIWQPIVGPLFDVFRIEANRLILLTIIITVSVFVIVVTYIVYEAPLVINWFVGGVSLNSTTSPSYSQGSSRRVPSTQRAPTSKQTVPTQVTEPRTEKGVDVRSLIQTGRDEIVLYVDIENNSEHKIEMVVVDVSLPAGIDTMTGSFRMQRVGTIESGESRRCTFRLTQTEGNLSEIAGHVEFMSSSYEITEVDIPAPEYMES